MSEDGWETLNQVKGLKSPVESKGKEYLWRGLEGLIGFERITSVRVSRRVSTLKCKQALRQNKKVLLFKTLPSRYGSEVGHRGYGSCHGLRVIHKSTEPLTYLFRFGSCHESRVRVSVTYRTRLERRSLCDSFTCRM